jgi:hypothetical protein
MALVKRSMDTKMIFTKDAEGKPYAPGTVLCVGKFLRIDPSPKFPNQKLLILQDPDRGTCQVPLSGVLQRIFPTSCVKEDYVDFVGRTFEIKYNGTKIAQGGNFKGKSFHDYEVSELVSEDSESPAVTPATDDGADDL